MVTEGSEETEGGGVDDSEASAGQSTELVRTEQALARINKPTTAARRVDKLRRAVSSKFTAAGVAGGAIALAFAPLPGLVPLVLLGAYIGGTFAAGARMRSFIKPLKASYLEVERGDLAVVEELCERKMRTAKWPISHLAALTLAYFARRRGRFDEALALNKLVAQDDDGLFREVIATELAVCHTLLGDITAAKTWLPPKRRRRHRRLSASFAIVWTRSGNTRNIYKLRLKPTRDNAEFVRHELRLLGVFKAFAVFERSPDYLSIRPLLMEAGPAFLAEFDYLGIHWPEMKEFVDTYVSPKDEGDPQKTGW